MIENVSKTGSSYDALIGTFKGGLFIQIHECTEPAFIGSFNLPVTPRRARMETFKPLKMQIINYQSTMIT